MDSSVSHWFGQCWIDAVARLQKRVNIFLHPFFVFRLREIEKRRVLYTENHAIVTAYNS